jgi:hypothetical protein
VIANNNPSKDIFLEMLELELDLPKDKQIRKVMQDEAQRLGLEIGDEKLAELQSYVGTGNKSLYIFGGVTLVAGMTI